MASMCLLRQTTALGQMGPQTRTVSSSPLSVSNSLRTMNLVNCLNLSTLSLLTPPIARAVGRARIIKETGFTRNGVCRLLGPSSRERNEQGTRKKRAMLMVRGSQYEGVIPLNISDMEERYNENGASTSTFDKLLDSSSPPRSESPPSSSGAAAALLKNSRSITNLNVVEEKIERTIFDFRFLTLFGVVGSLLGAVLCFLKGCLFVAHSYREYFHACFGAGVHSSRVILYLVEAVDVYLMGTVMLIFGMGLYELFVSSLEVPGTFCTPDRVGRSTVCGSNLFGLFRLRERPKWLEIRSLDELKTKLGHVIVMILLVGMFEKSKKVIVHTSMDFLCFSASILLSSGALFLLSMLHNHNSHSTHS